MMAGARPVFADIDPARLTIDPERIAARHRPADARDPAGASLRTGGRHGGARARSPRGTTSRSSKTAARRTSRPPPAGRSARSASPARSASIRPRISARSATAARSSPTIARSPTGSGGCATAARPTATITRSRASTRGSTKCRPRSCARGCRVCAGWTDRAARAGGALPRARWRGSAGRRAAASCDAGHVYHLFVVRHARRGRDLQAHLAARGIETLVHYPVPIPRQPALAALDPGRLPGRRRARATRCCRCRSIPGSTTTTSTQVAAAVQRDLASSERTRRVRALITGGAGFIGSHLSEALLEQRPRGADPRQPVDRLDRQHRAPQGARAASSTSSTR